MPKDPRKTTHVEDHQIVSEQPDDLQPGRIVEPRPRAKPGPPVRELSRTGFYERPTVAQPAQLPPEDAPPTQDESRVVREPVDPAVGEFVAYCPFPLIQLDAEGRIEWANEPFAEFARKPLEELAGERVDTTRLGIVYPSLGEDLVACREQAQPPTLRQTLFYQLQDGREVRRGCWIVPDVSDAGPVQRFFCYLLPIRD